MSAELSGLVRHGPRAVRLWSASRPSEINCYANGLCGVVRLVHSLFKTINEEEEKYIDTIGNQADQADQTWQLIEITREPSSAHANQMVDHADHFPAWPPSFPKNAPPPPYSQLTMEINPP
jgi:hypothetical protein